MFGKSNIISSPNMFKELNKKHILEKDKGTAYDNTSVNSKQSEIQDPLAHMRSDVQSPLKNVTQGSKSVFTNTTRNDQHNFNRLKLDLGKNSTPKNTLFEDTIFPKLINLEERAFGAPVKPIPGIKYQTDGITANNKNQFGLHGPRMSQKNADTGLRNNLVNYNFKIGNFTKAGTPRINRQMIQTSPNTKISSSGLKLKPEIKSIG